MAYLVVQETFYLYKTYIIFHHIQEHRDVQQCYRFQCINGHIKMILFDIPLLLSDMYMLSRHLSVMA